MVINFPEQYSQYFIKILESSLEQLRISKRFYLSLCDSMRSAFKKESDEFLSNFELCFNRAITEYDSKESFLLDLLNIVNPDKSYKE